MEAIDPKQGPSATGAIGGSNWKAHMRALAEEAAHDLIGTCKSIHELGPEIEAAMDDATFCSRLDELAFECTVCNWWCSEDELDDDQAMVCAECTD